MSTTRMRRTTLAAVLGLVGVATTAGVAAAQEATATRAVNFSVGGGFTVPVGDAGDAYKPGWNVQGTLGFQPANQAPIVSPSSSPTSPSASGRRRASRPCWI